MAGVVLSPSSVSVAPGGEAVCTVTIRNASAVVESYDVTVLGDAAAWATVTPASVSLFPGADGTAEVRFRPPRSSSLRAGPVDFAVRVAGSQSGDSVVEEGVADLAAFTELAARITPRTSEAKRRAKHAVSVDNKGNVPVSVSVAASDPDEALVFRASPGEVAVGPGETGTIGLTVASRKGFARGAAQHRPFQALVTADPQGTQPPLALEATFLQKAGLPGFVPALAAAAVILVAAVILIPGLTKDDEKSGTFSLTGASGSTTSVAAAAATDPAGTDGDEADAEPAPAGDPTSGGGGAETAAPSGPSAGQGGTPGAAITPSGVAPKPGPTTTVATTDDAPVTTSVAAPVTSSTLAPTTTAPAAYRGFVGTWAASGTCIAISTDDRTMSVTVRSSTTSMAGSAPATDANDGEFTVAYKAQNVQHQYQLVSTSTLRVASSPIGSLTRPTITDFVKAKC